LQGVSDLREEAAHLKNK